MALRIGKKKDAPTEAPENAPADALTDDWSDAALLGQTDEPQSTIPSPSTDEPDPADAFVTDTFATAPSKKVVSPVLLAGGLVLLVTALGVGAYFMFFNAPVEDEEIPAPPPRVVRRRVTPKPTPLAARPKTNVPVRKVASGKAGIPSANTKVPAIRSQGGKAPSVVPKPNMPTPVPLMPDGMAGQAGKGSSPGTTVQVVPPVGSPSAGLTPALQARLKALWKQGADAKHERNYNGARAAWKKMLQLRPGHPGVQEAIDKLPRSRP